MDKMINDQLSIVSRRRGFTLIELLIVVAIIGILAALLTTNFVAIRERARDAQRKSDMRQMQSALELYRSDNGSYPTSSGFKLPSSVVSGDNTCPTAGSFTSNGTTYMQKIPCDPLNDTTYYNSGYYYYSSNGTTYTLAACIENTNDTDQNVTSTSPGGSGCPVDHKYFVLQNP